MTKHYAQISPTKNPVSVTAQGETLANSKHALELTEFHFGKTFSPVLYIPNADVDFSNLVKNKGHTTHCPIKGDASYYSLKTATGLVENIAWSYENPVEGVQKIKDHLAFDTERTRLLRSSN